MGNNEFILDPKDVPASAKKSKIVIGNAYATPLTAFLAGVMVGGMAVYIVMIIYLNNQIAY